MKINKTNKYTRKYIWIISLSTILLGGYFLAAYQMKFIPFNNSSPGENREELKVNDINYDLPSSDEKEAGIQAKKEAQDRYQASDDSQGSAPQLVITSSNQTSEVLELRATISVIDDAGVCVLNLKKSGSTTITQEVGTQSMGGGYSICKGFNILIDTISKGEWTAEIKYTGANSSAVTTKNVKVE